MENEKKKKLPLGVRLLLLPFKIVLVILVIIILWFAFCRFDRIKPIDALPPDYALYLRTDKIWDTAEPLLDLNATLVAMTSPELQQYRETYLNIKSSKLRKNIFVQMALKRRVDAALYSPAGDANSGDFIVILDSGILSGALRLMPYLLPHIKKVQGQIELSSNSQGNYYMLAGKATASGKDSPEFFMIKKNLLVFTNSRTLLEEAMSFSNSSQYSSSELASMNAKLGEPLRILANGKYLAAFSKDELTQNYLSAVSSYLAEDEYSVLNFGITNNELNLSLSLPMAMGDGKSADDEMATGKGNAASDWSSDGGVATGSGQPHPVLELLKKESQVPTLLPRFKDDVQYYTLISAGSLRELKNAIEKILPEEKNFYNTWNKSDSVSKIVFNKTLDDILFSWTGDEFAVFGIEGKSEPVFAIKISNEEKRLEIFKSVFSSFIVQTNDSLLIDGVRLPCIQMPGFLLSILKTLDINVPKPYYLVRDNFIYFSQSPENLIAINQNAGKANKLSNNENWIRVSSKQSLESSLSLYYNLERSVPFFIKGNSAMSKILSLYNSGRFDLKLQDNTIKLQLQASAQELESSRHIPGFPIQLENKSDSLLVKSNAKKSNLIFWLENDSSINSLDVGNFSRQKKPLAELVYLIAASESTAKETKGEIWAITKNGLVYLLDSKLQNINGFPILSGINPSCPPFIYNEQLGLCGDAGEIIFISSDGKITKLESPLDSEIKSAPSVQGNTFAFYEKGFFGGLHIYKNLEPLTINGPLELDGIAYGSPCLLTNGSKEYIAMITQAGSLYVYDFEGNLLPAFPLELGGIFYLNVKSADGYIYALSSEGDLWRISLDGKSLHIKIPYFTAKTGHITIYNYDDKDSSEVFVSGEANSIYAFNSKLELLPGYPVSGFGNPLFIDLNGDNKKDCIAITIDNTLSASNVLK